MYTRKLFDLFRDKSRVIKECPLDSTKVASIWLIENVTTPNDKIWRLYVIATLDVTNFAEWLDLACIEINERVIQAELIATVVKNLDYKLFTQKLKKQNSVAFYAAVKDLKLDSCEKKRSFASKCLKFLEYKKLISTENRFQTKTIENIPTVLNKNSAQLDIALKNLIKKFSRSDIFKWCYEAANCNSCENSRKIGKKMLQLIAGDHSYSDVQTSK